jgi:methyltransferase (TIGR00027 family)
MAPPGSIENVSDTAYLIAAHRASESARPDALFHDVLADRLAGERGREIVAAAPRLLSSGWPVVARTKLIDDFILDAVSQGCDRVLNLAAGLDSRPYRLDLNPDFHWVEADLAELMDEKGRVLADENPCCHLKRHAVDLANPVALANFLDESLTGAEAALVLTEGLLNYLDYRDVDSLSAALRQRNVAWWVFDLFSPALARRLVRKSDRMLDKAPFKFAPADGVAFFEKRGWKTADVESMLSAAHRFKRLPLLMQPITLLPSPNPRRFGNKIWNGVVRLTS